jgi:hypothetical protein
MSAKSERKRVRKEMVATYIRSNPREGYDEISKRVNDEISKLGDTGTFADLAGIDKKLRSPTPHFLHPLRIFSVILSV